MTWLAIQPLMLQGAGHSDQYWQEIYTIVGYDPTDAALDADAEPHVAVP